MKYHGNTRNFRFRSTTGSPDKWTWITLKEGNEIPDSIVPILEKEASNKRKLDRVKDFEADLADDGKRNRSNKEKKSEWKCDKEGCKDSKPHEHGKDPEVPKELKSEKKKDSKKKKSKK